MNQIVGAVDLTRENKAAAAGPQSSQENVKPIVVISERYIPAGSIDSFKSGYLPAVDYLWDKVPGLKGIFVT